jgi:hypothetical protein
VGAESIAARAIYLLKGTVFLSFSDVVVGSNGPTAAASEVEASKALARVPWHPGKASGPGQQRKSLKRVTSTRVAARQSGMKHRRRRAVS